VAATSSTSNSDTPRKAGVPWAFLLALGVLFAIELVLHAVDERKLIAYASDYGQYNAVRDHIALGPAEIALVGSSQLREGVSMPVLIEELEKKLGRKVSVSNYALRGARVDAANAVVEDLLSQPEKPNLILVGLSVRDLRGGPRDYPRLTTFWDWADWWKYVRIDGWDVVDVTPQMVRKSIGDYSHLMKHREKFAIALDGLFEPLGVRSKEEPNPILGQGTYQHFEGRGLRRLDEAKVGRRHLIARIRENYSSIDGPKTTPDMIHDFGELAQQLQNAPCKSLLLEVPVSDLLNRLLINDGLRKHYDRAIAQVLTEHPVAYWPVADQPFKPGDEHFSDLQHLNRPGAEEYARMLAEKIAQELGASPPTRPARSE
jgi:lysophospholipase L1-like esterase